jgi:hypothetical protein
VKEGLINLDLADVRSVLSGMGTAMMGTGEAEGDQRAVTAAKQAIINPLLDDVTLRGAKSLLLSISGGSDLTLFEVHDAVDYVREQLDTEANIIFGATLDEGLAGRIRVSIVASGMVRSEAEARGRGADPRTGQDFRDRLSQAIDGYSPPDSSEPGRRQRSDAAIRSGAAGARHPGSGPAMPSVEDFPVVGQREYWAKVQDAPQHGGRSIHQRQPGAPSRKPGLLQRLTGGRHKRSEPHATDGHDPSGDEERIDMPVFFGRGKRT